MCLAIFLIVGIMFIMKSTLFKISRKSLKLILVISTLTFALINTFVLPFGAEDNYQTAFSEMIAREARKNEFNSIIVSYDINENNNKKQFFEFGQNQNSLRANSSLTYVNRDKNINLQSEDKTVSASVLLRDRIYTNKTSDGYYKMQTEDLWYFDEPISISKGDSKKSISISEAIAQTLLDTLQLESYKELGGHEISFFYQPDGNEIIEEKMFVRGVFLNEKGMMPCYRELYGENIVMFYDTYFEIPKTEAHIFLGGSSFKNKFNIKLLEEVGLKDFEIRDFNKNTELNSNLQSVVLSDLEYTNHSNKNYIIYLTVYCLLTLIILLVHVFVLTSFNNKAVLFINIAFLFILNELITYILSLFNRQLIWAVFLSSSRGIGLILYIFFMSTIVLFLTARKRNAENQSG